MNEERTAPSVRICLKEEVNVTCILCGGFVFIRSGELH